MPAVDRLGEMGAAVKDMPDLNPIKSRPVRLLVNKDSDKDV